MRILRYILSAVTLILALHGLITQNFEFNHIMIFFLGVTMLVMGIEELKKERKTYGWLFVLVFLFSLYVAIDWNYPEDQAIIKWENENTVVINGHKLKVPNEIYDFRRD